MDLHPRKLLTVVAEAALEKTLVEEIRQCGAHGYTITEARGGGAHGEHGGGFFFDANIRVEVVCDDATADRLATRLRDHYARDFALILYVADVAVLRPQKF